MASRQVKCVCLKGLSVAPRLVGGSGFQDRGGHHLGAADYVSFRTFLYSVKWCIIGRKKDRRALLFICLIEDMWFEVGGQRGCSLIGVRTS